MRKITYDLLILLLISTQVVAQTPIPAKNQEKAILLIGGVAHLGTGKLINNSLIAFDNGLLALVSENNIDIDKSKYQVIDIKGQHVYPGFILPNTQLGLHEVSAINAMNDTREVGKFNPNVRSLIAYNTDSKLPPTLRYNGVLMAETTPAGGIISGTSSLMNLDGWNWEDAVLKPDLGIHLNWPSRITRSFDFATFSMKKETNKNYPKQVEEVKAFFSDALGYESLKPEVRNLKLMAMQGLFSGEKTLFLHVNSASEIIEAVSFAKEFKVKKMVVISGVAAFEAVDFLVANKVPVILKRVHSLPERDDMDVNLPFKLPAMLTKAGLLVALSHSGDLASSRNLAFYAGTASAYGLDKEEALKLVTLNTAKILGVDAEVGSLEKGKRATLFVSKGDALDMLTNNLTHAFIDGKRIDLEGEQQQLYKRYSDKYKQAEE